MATTQVKTDVAKKAAQRCIDEILKERKKLLEDLVLEYKIKLENRWFKKYRKQYTEDEIVKCAKKDSFIANPFPDWCMIYYGQKSRAEEIIELCDTSSTGYINIDFKEAELINNWNE